jgi:hypothetical protein
VFLLLYIVHSAICGELSALNWRNEIRPSSFDTANLIAIGELESLRGMETAPMIRLAVICRGVSSDIPMNLVRSISPYHVSDSFIAARVVREPCIHLQNLVVHNHNGVTFCDKGFNLTPSECLRLALMLDRHVGRSGASIEAEFAVKNC